MQEKIKSFFELLCALADPRDNRGKRHEFAFVLASTVLAILRGQHRPSEIHRFMELQQDWLRNLLNRPTVTIVSRSQLPRIIDNADWKELNILIEQFFHIKIEKLENNWFAVDGKSLNGTPVDSDCIKDKEQILQAVSHENSEIMAQEKITGKKESDIPTVRKLLKATGLEQCKVSIDALHSNPETLAQIHKSGGTYLTAVKNNQPVLKNILIQISEKHNSIGSIHSVDKGHGRIEERTGTFFKLNINWLPSKWAYTGLNTLIVVDRNSYEIKKNKTSQTRMYYISNQNSLTQNDKSHKELFGAIRDHWKVEANNFVRDTIFQEDHIKTKNRNQAQIFRLLRTIAMKFIKKADYHKFKETTDIFCFNPERLEQVLHQTNFL